MALSKRDKERIIEELDRLDDAVREIVISSLDALAEWLMKSLRDIYEKTKAALKQLWEWLISQF